MVQFPFKVGVFTKKFLGIDIGTSSIKIVELSRRGGSLKLENYGEMKTSSIAERPFRRVERNALLLSNQDVAQAIQAILSEAKIETKETNFSIPDFSSFFTTFQLPPMTKEELPQAIRYEVRSHIPLPLSEITLDWLVTEGEVSKNSKTPLKILVVAVPNEVVNQYRQIASLAKLKLKSLEAEVFALARSLTENKERVIGFVDIGAQSTTVNILEKGVVKISHSFNISGNELTEILHRSLKVGYRKAEELKKNYGLVKMEQGESSLRDILVPLVNSILAEIKKIFNNFYQVEGKEVEMVVLAGGGSQLPGLKEYFFYELKKEVILANPFARISHPRVLDETLKEMGPTYAIAVGLALKGLE